MSLCLVIQVSSAISMFFGLTLLAACFNPGDISNVFSSPIWLEVHPQMPTQQPVLFLCRQEPVKLASEARQRTWRFLPSCRNTSEGKCDLVIKSPQGEAHNYSLSNSPELASWVQLPSASSFFRALSSTSVASAPPPIRPVLPLRSPSRR